MKKIILGFISFFVCIYVVNASSLVSEYLPYYVKIKEDTSDRIIQIKKIYDKDTLNVVFNIDYNNYEVSDNFKIYDKYISSIWKEFESSVDLFNTIVYYGYNENPSDLNYYLTQVLVWQALANAKVSLVDNNGNEISLYNDKYSEITRKYSGHLGLPAFAYLTYNVELWTTKNLKYSKNGVIMDNPVNENVTIKNDKLNLLIEANKVSENKLMFTKYYEQETYCYSDGKNIYWQSLRGPEDKEFYVNFNIYGTKFKIEENLIGINNRFGDAISNSKYELYLDNELKLSIKPSKEEYVKSNSKYLLKDISLSNGFINSEDINFEVEDLEYTLIVDKYVISKNITLDILDDKTYYVYLKSNDELYEMVDKNTDLITLPYGIYYITDQESYYRELLAEDMKDELVVIDNRIIMENKQELITESQEINLKPEKVYENKIIEEDIVIEEIIVPKIENPKTLDNIYFYLICFVLSLILTFYSAYLVKHK